MTEGTAVIAGALIGAIAGLAGGAFASYASLRASQLSARVALGPIIHEIANVLVKLGVARDENERFEALAAFESRWNEFSIHQRILCPSSRIENLMDLVRASTKDRSSPREALLSLAGQTLDKVTRMIGAHSNRLFGSRARKDEARIIRDWLASQEATLLSDTVRMKLAALADQR